MATSAVPYATRTAEGKETTLPPPHPLGKQEDPASAEFPPPPIGPRGFSIPPPPLHPKHGLTEAGYETTCFRRKNPIPSDRVPFAKPHRCHPLGPAEPFRPLHTYPPAQGCTLPRWNCSKQHRPPVAGCPAPPVPVGPPAPYGSVPSPKLPTPDSLREDFLIPGQFLPDLGEEFPLPPESKAAQKKRAWKAGPPSPPERAAASAASPPVPRIGLIPPQHSMIPILRVREKQRQGRSGLSLSPFFSQPVFPFSWLVFFLRPSCLDLGGVAGNESHYCSFSLPHIPRRGHPPKIPTPIRCPLGQNFGIHAW